MPRYRCNICSSGWARRFFEFESEAWPTVSCPNAKRKDKPCKGELYYGDEGQVTGRGVVELTDVHFLAFHAEGPILAAEGPRRVPCQPEREVTATPLEGGGEFFSCTSEPEAVTCPRCKESQLWKEAIELYQPEARVRRMGLRGPKPAPTKK